MIDPREPRWALRRELAPCPDVLRIKSETVSDPSMHGIRQGGRAGFTLLELMFAVAVIAILTTLAVGQFSKYVDRARNATAQGDIATMQVEIERYQNRHDGALPDSLSDIGRTAFPDPWQQAYFYTKLAGVNGHGGARKDHKLNPINSDYDLFSAGKNGVFKPQVSQKDSLDDIIRARDGGFIGLAEEF
ncbi:MAG: prepilin-type N-terminal cleavage/methylation domain-containing protein [Luteimonas sp.]|nr:prepilin-type N-terminal cleavage/methylation domain-containing protein [Luteimonas sp.]